LGHWRFGVLAYWLLLQFNEIAYPQMLLFQVNNLRFNHQAPLFTYHTDDPLDNS
jgi:hypothetical protein